MISEKEMDLLQAHYCRYFEQDNPLILHPSAPDAHIDILKFEPTEKYPFVKLATMGASEFRMKGKNPLGNRNEYMMFIDAGEKLNDNATLGWYLNKLADISLFAVLNETMVSYGHSLEWNESGEEIVGAYLEMPQIIEDSGILRCRLGLLKTAVCLQATLLNQAEMDQLAKIGPQAFSEYLYPETGDRCHFLSQRHRTDRF